MDITAALTQALLARRPLLPALHDEQTTCYRLLQGAVEGAPGVTVDRYGPVLLLQTWRDPLDVDRIEAWTAAASEAVGTTLQPVWNHRARGEKRSYAQIWPCPPIEAVGLELGLSYDVRPRHRGRDPLLFVDLRVGRRWVKSKAEGKEVLNLFAYTCGMGLAAAAGGASDVLNVDFATSALEVGTANAALNGLDNFHVLCEDALPVMRLLAGLPVRQRKGKRRRVPRVDARQFDLVLLDPPRWATSPWGAVDVVRDYPSLLKPAVLSTREGGTVLATNHVHRVELDDWLAVVKRCVEKAGRSLRGLEMLRPESDVPSPDGQHPLKIALLHV